MPGRVESQSELHCRVSVCVSVCVCVCVWRLRISLESRHSLPLLGICKVL